MKVPTQLLCKILLCLILFQTDAFTQSKKKKIPVYERDFQFSFFPGIGTNGISSGSFNNKYSINLLTGISAGNRVFEIGSISNINLYNLKGFQLAGLANIVGSNAFINLTASEKELLRKEGFRVNANAIQIAGLLNFVLNDVSGIQMTLGLNYAGDNLNGFQIAAIGNDVGGSAHGIQIGGLYNTAIRSATGIQISTILNTTNGRLLGTQIGLINKAKAMIGKKSTPPTKIRSTQLGLINISKKTEGTQIGLINFGGKMRGTQIGLINIFDRKIPKEITRNGTPIGLLNIGTMGTFFRVYSNEINPINFEVSTGNCSNCTNTMYTKMPLNEKYKKLNQNALIFGIDRQESTWSIGYGFRKILLKKRSMTPHPGNEKTMISYGANFLHLNRSMSYDRNFNLLTKLSFGYGIRLFGVHWFSGVTLNYFLEEDHHSSEEIYNINVKRVTQGSLYGLRSSFWFGYAFGIHI